VVFSKKDFIIEFNDNPMLKYEIISNIGMFGHGEISIVWNKSNNNIYRMKKYNLSKVKKSDIDFEIYVTKDLSHPNMISLFEYYVDEYNTYLITEYC